MLLIAVLIQPLTQQPRYYLLTTVRQPLRSISWFVPAARSRLACGRPVCRRLSHHARQARHSRHLTSTGTAASVTSSLPCPSDVISAHPRF